MEAVDMSIGEFWPQTYLSAGYHLEDETDFSGNSYTLTNNNSVAFVTGKFRKCADFGNGIPPNTNKWLGRSGNLGFTSSDPCSIVLWYCPTVQPAALNIWQLCDLIVGSGGSMKQYAMQYKADVNGNRSIYVEVWTNASHGVTFNGTLATNSWHCIELHYDGGTSMRGVLDGVVQSLSITDATFGDVTKFSIGCLNNDGSNCAAGYIDECVVFKQFRTAAMAREYYRIAMFGE
jgi:hypothetical protein